MHRIFWEALFAVKAFVTGFWVRDKNLVAIISCHRQFTGNCKYAVQAIQKAYPEKNIIWIVETPEQGQAIERLAGVQFALRHRVSTLHMITKAGYILSDGNFFGHFMANGATQIDFWHGYPVKKIRYDHFGYEPSFIKKILWWINRKNFIECSGADFITGMQCNTHRVPHSMGRSLGQPYIAPLVDKNILLQDLQQNPLLKSLYKEFNQYKKVFLYVPTFRDDGDDFLNILKFDIEKLAKICQQKNVLFLIKLHMYSGFELTENYDNVRILDAKYDGTTVAAMADVIVTDYCVMYHYGMVANKDVILIHGDLDHYRAKTRDLYDWAIDDLQGHIINDFDDLCDIIKTQQKIIKIPQHTKEKYFSKENLENPFRFLKIFEKQY